MALRNKPLRSGFTTGACAAAAAKAATVMLRQDAPLLQSPPVQVDLPFPDGSRHYLKINNYNIEQGHVSASVIKDAGDDPDVTNGAEIVATVKKIQGSQGVIIKGGNGVGIVTKPGLPIKVGQWAINPVPLKMIKEAVSEVINSEHDKFDAAIEVVISVPEGKQIAKRTLNHRLGIIDGISILGTTGIVQPLSADAWTATIVSTMKVAKATDQREIVLSTGRTSESAHIKKYNLPVECYVMMGDYIEFAINEAQKFGFQTIHLCAQWAKMLKIAMGITQTHVRFGVLEVQKAIDMLCTLEPDNNISSIIRDYKFNTAREAFEMLQGLGPVVAERYFNSILRQVARRFMPFARDTIFLVHLVSYDQKIIASLKNTYV